MIATAIRIAAAAGLGGMAGLLGGLFGVGGGFLVIPLLGFFYGMDQQTAQGTVLIMVVPNVVWAFSRYRRRFGVNLRMAATIALSRRLASPVDDAGIDDRSRTKRGGSHHWLWPITGAFS